MESKAAPVAGQSLDPLAARASQVSVKALPKRQFSSRLRSAARNVIMSGRATDALASKMYGSANRVDDIMDASARPPMPARISKNEIQHDLSDTVSSARMVGRFASNRSVAALDNHVNLKKLEDIRADFNGTDAQLAKAADRILVQYGTMDAALGAFYNGSLYETIPEAVPIMRIMAAEMTQQQLSSSDTEFLKKFSKSGSSRRTLLTMDRSGPTKVLKGMAESAKSAHRALAPAMETLGHLNSKEFKKEIPKLAEGKSIYHFGQSSENIKKASHLLLSVNKHGVKGALKKGLIDNDDLVCIDLLQKKYPEGKLKGKLTSIEDLSKIITVMEDAVLNAQHEAKEIISGVDPSVKVVTQEHLTKSMYWNAHQKLNAMRSEGNHNQLGSLEGIEANSILRHAYHFASVMKKSTNRDVAREKLSIEDRMLFDSLREQHPESLSTDISSLNIILNKMQELKLPHNKLGKFSGATLARKTLVMTQANIVGELSSTEALVLSTMNKTSPPRNASISNYKNILTNYRDVNVSRIDQGVKALRENYNMSPGSLSTSMIHDFKETQENLYQFNMSNLEFLADEDDSIHNTAENFKSARGIIADIKSGDLSRDEAMEGEPLLQKAHELSSEAASDSTVTVVEDGTLKIKGKEHSQEELRVILILKKLKKSMEGTGAVFDKNSIDTIDLSLKMLASETCMSHLEDSLTTDSKTTTEKGETNKKLRESLQEHFFNGSGVQDALFNEGIAGLKLHCEEAVFSSMENDIISQVSEQLSDAYLETPGTSVEKSISVTLDYGLKAIGAEVTTGVTGTGTLTVLHDLDGSYKLTKAGSITAGVSASGGVAAGAVTATLAHAEELSFATLEDLATYYTHHLAQAAASFGVKSLAKMHKGSKTLKERARLTAEARTTHQRLENVMRMTGVIGENESLAETAANIGDGASRTNITTGTLAASAEVKAASTGIAGSIETSLVHKKEHQVHALVDMLSDNPGLLDTYEDMIPDCLTEKNFNLYHHPDATPEQANQAIKILNAEAAQYAKFVQQEKTYSSENDNFVNLPAVIEIDSAMHEMLVKIDDLKSRRHGSKSNVHDQIASDISQLESSYDELKKQRKDLKSQVIAKSKRVAKSLKNMRASRGVRTHDGFSSAINKVRKRFVSQYHTRHPEAPVLQDEKHITSLNLKRQVFTGKIASVHVDQLREQSQANLTKIHAATKVYINMVQQLDAIPFRRVKLKSMKKEANARIKSLSKKASSPENKAKMAKLQSKLKGIKNELGDLESRKKSITHSKHRFENDYIRSSARSKLHKFQGRGVMLREMIKDFHKQQKNYIESLPKKPSAEVAANLKAFDAQLKKMEGYYRTLGSRVNLKNKHEKQLSVGVTASGIAVETKKTVTVTTPLGDISVEILDQEVVSDPDPLAKGNFKTYSFSMDVPDTEWGPLVAECLSNAVGFAQHESQKKQAEQAANGGESVEGESFDLTIDALTDLIQNSLIGAMNSFVVSQKKNDETADALAGSGVADSAAEQSGGVMEGLATETAVNAVGLTADTIGDAFVSKKVSSGLMALKEVFNASEETEKTKIGIQMQFEDISHPTTGKTKRQLRYVHVNQIDESSTTITSPVGGGFSVSLGSTSTASTGLATFWGNSHKMMAAQYGALKDKVERQALREGKASDVAWIESAFNTEWDGVLADHFNSFTNLFTDLADKSSVSSWEFAETADKMRSGTAEQQQALHDLETALKGSESGEAAWTKLVFPLYTKVISLDS